MSKPIILDEWEVTLTIRQVNDPLNMSPDKWDFNVLLDLNSGQGEQAWADKVLLKRIGTEEDLDENSAP